MTDDEVMGVAMKILHAHYQAVDDALYELPDDDDIPKIQFISILADSNALILGKALSMLGAADREFIKQRHDSIVEAALKMAQTSGGSLGTMEKYDMLYAEENKQ